MYMCTYTYMYIYSSVLSPAKRDAFVRCGKLLLYMIEEVFFLTTIGAIVSVCVCVHM